MEEKSNSETFIKSSEETKKEKGIILEKAQENNESLTCFCSNKILEGIKSKI